MKARKKKTVESFEPKEKFVFINDWVFTMPQSNVDKQVLTELRFEAYKVARQLREELASLGMVQVENPETIESKVSRYIR